MKKLTIEISDEAHTELLKLQLSKRLSEGSKKPLAVVAAEALHDFLVKNEKPAK